MTSISRVVKLIRFILYFGTVLKTIFTVSHWQASVKRGLMITMWCWKIIFVNKSVIARRFCKN